jgi:hypothetical protein
MAARLWLCLLGLPIAPGCIFGDDGDSTVTARSCLDILALDPFAPSGIHRINPDGRGGESPFDVLCEMTANGGGWTLALTSSDDQRSTWTNANHALLTVDRDTVGDLDRTNHDFKSPALHAVAFADLMFWHQPSGVTAVYGQVGDGFDGFGAFLDRVPYPNCDTSSSYPLTGGTLQLDGRLCTTDLYFNPGDFDEGGGACNSLTSLYNSASFGPVWSAAVNDGCPLDDPSLNGIGPENDLCGDCEENAERRENRGRGFGSALDLNTGVDFEAENYIQMWVR